MGRNWLLESHEDVQFTVYRPRVIVPERWEPLLAFAHLSERSPDAPGDGPDPLEEVARQARGVLGDQIRTFSQIRQDPVQGVPAEAEISLVPEIPGFRIEPPMRTFRWIEEVHREEFKIRAGAELNGQVARGRLTVFLGRIVLAEGPLAIRVDRAASASASQQPTETASVQPFRRIFASYSHRDEAVVVELERYARVLGDRYLRDVRDLRAGEAWSERLEELIRTADVFQLFWSWNALRSPFVEREWRYALSLGRPHFVRPTYWEEPFPEDLAHKLPPDELRRLHFQLLRGGAGSHSLPTGHLLDDTATAERVHAEDPPTAEAQLLENSAVREGAMQWTGPTPPGEHGNSATAIGGGKELSSPGSSQANRLQPSPIAAQTLPSRLPTGPGLYLALGLALAVIGVASFLGSRSGIKGSALKTPDAPIQSPSSDYALPQKPIPEPPPVHPAPTVLPKQQWVDLVQPPSSPMPATAPEPPLNEASLQPIASASSVKPPIDSDPTTSEEEAGLDRFKRLEETILSIERLSEQTREAHEEADLGGSIGGHLESFVESAVDLRKTFRQVTGTGTGIGRVKLNIKRIFGKEADPKALEDKVRDLVRRGEEIDRLAASDPLGPTAGEHWQEVKRHLKQLNQYF